MKLTTTLFILTIFGSVAGFALFISSIPPWSWLYLLIAGFSFGILMGSENVFIENCPFCYNRSDEGSGSWVCSPCIEKVRDKFGKGKS